MLKFFIEGKCRKDFSAITKQFLLLTWIGYDFQMFCIPSPNCISSPLNCWRSRTLLLLKFNSTISMPYSLTHFYSCQSKLCYIHYAYSIQDSIQLDKNLQMSFDFMSYVQFPVLVFFVWLFNFIFCASIWLMCPNSQTGGTGSLYSRYKHVLGSLFFCLFSSLRYFV